MPVKQEDNLSYNTFNENIVINILSNGNNYCLFFLFNTQQKLSILQIKIHVRVYLQKSTEQIQNETHVMSGVIQILQIACHI